MELKQIYQIYESLENFNILKYEKIICKNLKKIRLELYNKYKIEYKKIGSDNPYSSSNVADYLNISEVYYRRLESPNDKYKHINVDKLIRLSIIFNVSINDFISE